MKVRITDLMDNYFDDSIHLIPPEKLPDRGSIKEEAPLMEQKHPRGLQKGLLIAASIMLVLTATAALVLGFFHWNASPAPVALAEGGDTIYSAEEPEAPEEAEPAAMESQPPSPTPGLSDEISPYLMEQLDSTLLTYTQRGDQSEFLFTLSPMTQETYATLQQNGFAMWIGEAENAFAPAPPAEIHDAGVTHAEYDSDAETLLVRASATLSGTDETWDFVPVIQENKEESDTHDHYFCGTELSLELSYLSDYSIYNAETLMAFYSPVDSNYYCSIDTLTVSPSSLTISGIITAPPDATVETISDTWPMDTMAQSGVTLQLETNDEMEVFAFEGTPVDVQYTASADGDGIWDFYMTYEQEIVTPTDIVSTAFQFPEGTFDDEEPDAIDGDGLLTAEINLSFPHLGMEDTDIMDTIVRLVIDPEEGTYTWYTRLFGEQPGVINAGIFGDFDELAEDDEFREMYTNTENYLLEHYYRNAYLVFTDGTRIRVGSGDRIGHDTETMMFSEQTPLAAVFEETEIDWQSLTFDYLELNGEIYYFE